MPAIAGTETPPALCPQACAFAGLTFLFSLSLCRSLPADRVNFDNHFVFSLLKEIAKRINNSIGTHLFSFSGKSLYLFSLYNGCKRARAPRVRRRRHGGDTSPIRDNGKGTSACTQRIERIRKPFKYSLLSILSTTLLSFCLLLPPPISHPSCEGRLPEEYKFVESSPSARGGNAAQR